MSEHREWQKTVSLRKFNGADQTIPRQVRISRAAAYVGATIPDVEAWLKADGLGLDDLTRF